MLPQCLMSSYEIVIRHWNAVPVLHQHEVNITIYKHGPVQCQRSNQHLTIYPTCNGIRFLFTRLFFFKNVKFLIHLETISSCMVISSALVHWWPQMYLENCPLSIQIVDDWLGNRYTSNTTTRRVPVDAVLTIQITFVNGQYRKACASSLHLHTCIWDAVTTQLRHKSPRVHRSKCRDPESS